MKRSHIPSVIKACHLSFHGIPDKNIANQMNVSQPTISHWRNHPAWQKAENRLIETAIDTEIHQGIPKETESDREEK